MSEESNKNEELNRSTKSIDKKRRSLTKVGIAAPVVMTLASKSALGAGSVQCTWSGIMSGNISNPDHVRCEGCTPGYWKNHQENWPTGYISEIVCTSFNPAGNCTAYTGDPLVVPTIFTNVFVLNRGIPGGLSLMEVFLNRNITVAADGTITKTGSPLSGNLKALGGHAIAALFNTFKLSNYGNDSSEILAWWNNSSLTNNELKDRYVMLNERYCPLN